MKAIIMVFLGGGLGSIARYLLSSWIGRSTSNPFPLGTLTVNILACFVAGLTAGLLSQRMNDETSRLFIVTGFCGGFSTFSAFTLDSVRLLNHGMISQMTLYIVLSLVVCTVATFAGAWLAVR